MSEGYADKEKCERLLEVINRRTCCASCARFESLDHATNYGKGVQYTGICRLNPPVQNLHPRNDPDERTWAWPAVDWDDWCGQHLRTEDGVSLEEVCYHTINSEDDE